jgi:ATP synthase F1 complex assembly factor 1
MPLRLLKNPSIRRLFAKSAQPLRSPSQRRWARVQDVRSLATQGGPDRILDRYREKLARKAKECVNADFCTATDHRREGLRDINALREAYRSRLDALNKETVAKGLPPQQPATTGEQIPFSPPPPPEAAAAAPKPPSTPPGVKTLASFLDVAKTRTLPAAEIETVWRLRHASNPRSLSACFPATTYARMALAARRHPQFVLPVPREGQGAEMHFLQWTFPARDAAAVLFTRLAEYKLRGEWAAPHTTLSMHLELVEDKGLVLAQGQVVEDRGVAVEDAKWLLMCLQKFYGAFEGVSGNERSRALLQQFTDGDASFDVQKLLDEAERVG